MTPDVTEDDVLTALRAFLLAVLPGGVEVVTGQVNRVPEPASPDHVIMTPMSRQQLGTTTHDYDPVARINQVGRSNALTFQLDVYGPSAMDNAQVIATLFRDDYGCAFLAPYGVQPLYCDDGHQMPLVNGEMQYEDRWTLRAVVQANPHVSTPAEFMDSVRVILKEVG